MIREVIYISGSHFDKCTSGVSFFCEMGAMEIAFIGDLVGRGIWVKTKVNKDSAIFLLFTFAKMVSIIIDV